MKILFCIQIPFFMLRFSFQDLPIFNLNDLPLYAAIPARTDAHWRCCTIKSFAVYGALRHANQIDQLILRIWNLTVFQLLGVARIESI